MDINRINQTAPPAEVSQSDGTRFQTRPELVRAVTAVDSAKLFGEDSELTFAMDRETRRTVIRLVDRESRKVIRQIPAEYVLHLAQELSRDLDPGSGLG